MFKHKQMEAMPILDLILKEKFVQLHKKVNSKESTYIHTCTLLVSTGWQWRFFKWHGIHNLSLPGEKLITLAMFACGRSLKQKTLVDVT